MLRRMPRSAVFLLILHAILVLAVSSASASTQTWALVVSGSRYWFNYRHTANAMAVYSILKQNGIPDSRIILALSEDHSTKVNNQYFGAVYVSDKETLLGNTTALSASTVEERPTIKARTNLYDPTDTEVDIIGTELTAATILGIITGRERYGSAPSQRFHLPSAEDEDVHLGRHSSPQRHLLIYMTGHGGDGFLKLSDKEEITAVDLGQAVSVALRSKRFHSVTALFDTCQAATLHENWFTPGSLAFSSSVRDQNSYAYGIDDQPPPPPPPHSYEEAVTVEQIADNYRFINRRAYYPAGVGQSISDGFTRLLWEHLSSGSPQSTFKATPYRSADAVLPAAAEQQSAPFRTARDILMAEYLRRKNGNNPLAAAEITPDRAWQPTDPSHAPARQPPQREGSRPQHSVLDVIQNIPGWRIGSTVTEHTSTVGSGALEAYYRLSVQAHGLLHPIATPHHIAGPRSLHAKAQHLMHQARQLASSLKLGRGSHGGENTCSTFWANEEAYRIQFLKHIVGDAEDAASIYVHSLLQCERGPLLSTVEPVGFVPTAASASYLSKCRDGRVALASCLHRSLEKQLGSGPGALTPASGRNSVKGELLSAHEPRDGMPLATSAGKALLQLTAAEHIFGDSD